ncbi:MAG: hypothetical protein AAF621_07510 [Pseudomonadota bacterium]
MKNQQNAGDIKVLKNLPIFDMSSARMQHATKRHSLIAGNIAHADTPGYIGKDLQKFSVDEMPMGMRATRTQHLNFENSLDPYNGLKDPMKQAAFDQSLNRNKVSVEEEIAKAAEAQASFKLSSGIWSKSMSLFMSVIDSRR